MHRYEKRKWTRWKNGKYGEKRKEAGNRSGVFGGENIVGVVWDHGGIFTAVFGVALQIQDIGGNSDRRNRWDLYSVELRRGIPSGEKDENQKVSLGNSFWFSLFPVDGSDFILCVSRKERVTLEHGGNDDFVYRKRDAGRNAFMR